MRRSHLASSLALVVAAGASCAAAPVATAPPQPTPAPTSASIACTRDFAVVRDVMPRAYAGWPDKRARYGSDIDSATTAIERALPRVADARACDTLLAQWLEVFHDGHVSLWSPRLRDAQRARDANLEHASSTEEPTATLVDDDAIVVRVPSFSPEHRGTLDALLETHAAELERRALLVVDVRGNAGGSDGTYASLLPLLYTDPVVDAGAEAAGGPEVAASWERVLGEVPADATELRREILALAARIRSAPVGSFVNVSDRRTLTLDGPRAFPGRVAVVVDRGCKSACEQLLLAARQSKKTVLMGTASGGVLDYANVRPFPLGLGTDRVLLLATTRSRRLPAEPVDGIGIAPHVPVDESELAALDAPGLVHVVRTRSAP